MDFSFWSDEDRLFVSRRFGFGWSINFKYIARRLGLVRDKPGPISADTPQSERSKGSRQDRVRAQIEASKYEERRH